MFEYGFPKDWSTLKKLIWLKRFVASSPSWAWEVLTGTAPLALLDAVAHPIHSLTQFGLCVQDGTPTPNSPVDVLTNNGALRYSANMANVNAQTALVGYYINAQGRVLADTYNWFYQDFIPCKPNTTYTLSMSVPAYYVTISEYSTAEDSGFIVRKNGTTGANTSLTITTEATTNYIRFGTNLDRTAVTLERVLGINWMLNIGNTAMDYQPYVEGGIYTEGESEVLTVSASGAETQTVTGIRMLLSTGDDGVDDEIELISGLKTGKVRAHVFDGTEEEWTFDATYDRAIFRPLPNFRSTTTRNVKLLCSHFVSKYNSEPISDLTVGDFYNATQNGVVFHVAQTSLEDWKAFLAAQYAAGTPVIVIYPRANEQTEQGTPHSLHTSAGTNVVDVTAAVSPVQLSVEYAKST